MASGSAQIIPSAIELVLSNCFEQLDLLAIFGRRAPMEVDLGCGDGSLLVAMAAENPDRDFLGVERLLGRVRTTCRKIKRAGLTNARVLRFEIAYVVEHLLPPGSVTAFYLFFPDPWPKRRHAARRVVSVKLLASLNRALVDDGVVQVATDETEYFRQINRAVSASPGFSLNPIPRTDLPSTKFERRFRARGVQIHRLELRKVSPVK